MRWPGDPPSTVAATAASFVSAYRLASGRDLDDIRRGQALWTVSAMRWIPLWVAGFHASGLTHLTLPLLQERLQILADQALDQL